MKITKILTLSVLSAFFASCTNNDDVVLLDVESLTVSNLHAPQSGGQGQPVSGDFTKFDFETGQIPQVIAIGILLLEELALL